MYSVAKKPDLGKSLVKEPLIRSSPGKTFDEIRHNEGLNSSFGDFAPYGPLNEEPATWHLDFP